MAPDYYDELETRPPEVRERALMAALARQVAHARKNSTGFAEWLAAVDPPSINSRAALAALPVLRKSDLTERQAANPPFGGLTVGAPGDLAHIFMSPGPIYEPEGRGDDAFGFARALFAAGFRRGDVIHNCYAYHLTPAGMMVDGAARALGCAVIPGGVGNTELQVRAIADLRPVGYTGTPSFLRIILERAAEAGADVSSLKRGLVGGEALPPSLRRMLADLGCSVLQAYGTADLGLIAYESEAIEGMILHEGLVVEIVRPGTGDPVPDGEVGEVVVTTLNPHYPLIRFATGDMSAILAGTSPCGRTNTRIKGWMGRADQTTKIRGMFVHPGQVSDIVKRHLDIVRARLVVTGESGRDSMTLTCEVAGGEGGPALADAIRQTVIDVTKLRGEVVFAGPGALPNDGKVIEDARSYE